MFNKIILYIQRRRQHSYTELWEMLYGDDWYKKGYIREYRFAMEAASTWRQAYEDCKKKSKQSPVDLKDDQL